MHFHSSKYIWICSLEMAIICLDISVLTVKLAMLLFNVFNQHHVLIFLQRIYHQRYVQDWQKILFVRYVTVQWAMMSGYSSAKQTHYVGLLQTLS